MIEIYSKVEPDVLLHRVIRKDTITKGRTDFSEPREFLQVSGLSVSAGKTYLSHIHKPCRKFANLTQESWVVVKGSVVVTYYDLDGTKLRSFGLWEGCCSVTYRGGHGYKILEDNTIVYEFKTGPYYGQEQDKEFI